MTSLYKSGGGEGYDWLGAMDWFVEQRRRRCYPPLTPEGIASAACDDTQVKQEECRDVADVEEALVAVAEAVVAVAVAVASAAVVAVVEVALTVNLRDLQHSLLVRC